MIFHQVNIKLRTCRNLFCFFFLVFDQSTATVFVNENTDVSTNIFNTTVTDTNPYSTLSYGISSGNAKNIFVFVEDSNNVNDASRVQYQAILQLKLVGLLDYSDQRIYNLVLFAFDGKNLATLNIIVNVVSSYGSTPVFPYQPIPYEYYIRENTTTTLLNTAQVSFIFST